MRTHDFEYDGLNLSSFGYIICDFDKSGKKTISNGSEITFVNATTRNGAKWEPTGVTYGNFLETKFGICKNPCGQSDLTMTMDEVRTLSRWLNRKENRKFKLLSDEYQNVYFEGSFNLELVKINDQVQGMNLEFKSNRPYALEEEKTFFIRNKEKDGCHVIYDLSDDVGFIYPKTVIRIESNGDLQIVNQVGEGEESHTTETMIANCKKGEEITMDYPMIESSDKTHAIQNDFNWQFFRISNTFKDSVNRLTVSLPCSIEIRYSPIAKIGL